jgi:hypothetical protein
MLQTNSQALTVKRAGQILSEPLVQFLIIGAAIFLIDWVVTAYRQDDTNIVINDTQLDELVSIFVHGQGREPSVNEVDNLIIKWTQNEIFFREAKKMGLDQGDEMIRSRLVLKMQNVLYSSVTSEVPTDGELESWFDDYRENYDMPAKYTIEQFFFARNRPDELNAAGELVLLLKDTSVLSKLAEFPELTEFESKLRRYQNRPAATFTGLFEQQSLNKLLATDIDQWRVIHSEKGIHLARVVAVESPKQAIFGDIKRQVIKDWKQYSNDLQLMQQTTDIANRYTVDITAVRGVNVGANSDHDDAIEGDSAIPATNLTGE